MDAYEIMHAIIEARKKVVGVSEALRDEGREDLAERASRIVQELRAISREVDEQFAPERADGVGVGR